MGRWIRPRSSRHVWTVSRRRLPNCGGTFDLDAKKKELLAIEEKISAPEFWADPKATRPVMQRRRILSEEIAEAGRLETDLQEAEVFAELAAEGEGVSRELQDALDKLDKDITELEFGLMLEGEFDSNNAIVAIHSGAGGTESQDWAQMLMRMLTRWAERRGYKVDLVDRQDGEEAGIKSATMTVAGDRAFGHLKAEKGVHRLVRISPFDASARRHTSFASIDVIPEVDDAIEIEINEKDLRVDTFRSSGAGGQHVNVTDSAIRITHIPTNIVVQCQNERSQHRNREVAMRILRARLYERALHEQEEKRKAQEGQKMKIDFGSQIRSYVLQPYRMVKDHRTGVEVGDVDRVLDGDLDQFIRAYLLSNLDSKASA
jgi:peptide chain release factor 2